MPEGQTVGETTTTTSSFSILTSMMPRQVMLSASSNSMSNGRKAIPSLTAEQRKLLLQTVCQFLELNGFSKTLKKFLSEAQIEKDSSKNSLYNLEDMCSQYLDMRASCDGDYKNTKKLDKQNDDITGVDNGTESIASKDKAKKEKKKQSKTHSEGNDVEPSQQSEIVKICDKELQEGANLKSKKKKKSSNDSLPIVEDTPFEDVTRDEKSLKKLKEKKKSKPGPDSSVEDLKQKQEEGLQRVKEETKISSDAEKKSKSKSEKKMKVSSSIEIVEDKSGKNKHGDDTNESGDHEDVMEKEKKNSKKRKRVSEENEVEELKQSETDGSSEMKASDSKKEDNMVESQTPAAGIHSNGFLEHNGGDKSMGQKSSKKQKTAGSTLPKSVNAFKRVDPDKVVIDDERLQDNSYWAKDGADSGYGAKAQEILGQVRGRDFRHEKTKKKRGSYRGGHIDLDSHSIKFNYSEEDE